MSESSGQERPTLADLLLTLGCQDDSPRVAPDAAAELRLDEPIEDGLRQALLAAIQAELGSSIGELAQQMLRNGPLTYRTAQRTLQAALDLAGARQAAFLAAGLSPGLEAPAPKSADRPATAVEQRARARWDNAARPPQPDAVDRTGAAAVLPPARLPVASEGRHAALLEYCRQLVAPQPRSDLEEMARQLHDRVRAFLERHGQWPLRSAYDYERHAKPAAHVLADWDIDDP